MELRDAHVVITGASKGIGASLARAVAARGSRVSLLARSEGPLKKLAKELGGYTIAVDLSRDDEVDGLIKRIEQAGGPVDALVNNAVYSVSGEFVARSAHEIRMHILTNLLAPMELCRQVIPGMASRGRGNLLAISSIGGEVSTRNTACYSTAKAGLNQFTLNLRRELRRTPLTVSLAILSTVHTDALVEGARDPHLAAVHKRLRLIGAMDPHDVGEALADALARDQKTLCLPKSIAPMVHLRQLPSRATDLLMLGLD